MEGKMTLHWEGAFDSAHNLYHYDGKCANLHGHRWQVKVDVAIDVMDYLRDGISVDFNEFKAVVNDLDHKYVNAMLPEFSAGGLSPSAENLVQYLADMLQAHMNGKQGNPRLKRLELFETPNNSVVIEF